MTPVRRLMKRLRSLGIQPNTQLWPKLLPGAVVIGEGTRIHSAQLSVADATGCFLTIGEQSDIEARLVFERASASITIGSRTHIGTSLLDATCSIEIGDDVMIAFEVLVMDHDSHSLNYSQRQNDVREWMQGRKDWTHVQMAPVRIESKAWIGTRATILKGVTVGEGAIVGAGSVVTKNVAAWTVVGGNPAKVIRTLDYTQR